MAEKLLENLRLDESPDRQEQRGAGVEEPSTEESDEYIPSKVMDVAYIYTPPSFRNFEETEEWKTSGKWMLYSHGDMERLDYMWTRLQPLVENGTLVGLKSSTATDTVNGVVMCFTSNYDDKEDVKRAADAIRDALYFENIIYYKTNEASESGLYSAHGDVNISKYMHTVACSLYEKDENNRWMKITNEPVDLFI